MEYLSDIELYYTPYVQNDSIALIAGNEFQHITRVMRHKQGDEIFFTNGLGAVFKGEITSIQKDNLNVQVLETRKYDNNYSNLVFCLPKLKAPDRFEYALEKCAELGITRFAVFSSERSFMKGDKQERWANILLSAMKQSLRSYLPVIETICTYEQLLLLDTNFVLFHQHAAKSFDDVRFESGKNYHLIFGPEGGLTRSELQKPSPKETFRLSPNRLRTETAAVTAAALIGR